MRFLVVPNCLRWNGLVSSTRGLAVERRNISELSLVLMHLIIGYGVLEPVLLPFFFFGYSSPTYHS